MAALGAGGRVLPSAGKRPCRRLRPHRKKEPAGRCLPFGVGLTYGHPAHMVFHMKTTLNIDDTVMAQLKREAARQGRTMSELVETALRNLFRSQKEAAKLSPLPVFHSGGAFVDIADRDALYQAMEGR
jgi:Ribbon-helix-helix protein, copG family